MSSLDCFNQNMPRYQVARVAREEIGERVGRMEEIVEKAKAENRELTSAECRVVDSLEAETKTIHAYAGHAMAAEDEQRARSGAELDRRIAAGVYPVSDDGVTSSHGTGRGMQTDSAGRRYAILAKGDKATDVYRPQSDNEMGHYILAKAFGANRGTPEHIRNAMKESDPTLGGDLVPNEYSSQVIDLMRARSGLSAAGMRVAMMESQSMTIPKIVSDATVETKAENATINASDITLGSRLLQTHTAAALVKMSRELYEDSAGLAAEMVVNALAAKNAQQVDQWGINGTGSEEPMGILINPLINATGSVGAIDWTDVSAAATRIRNDNGEPTACIVNPTIHDDLFNLETGDGTNSARGWLGKPPTLKNVDFIPTSNCPLASAVLGDFSKYLMGVRTGARIEASNEAGDAFEKHQHFIKIVMRFDFVCLDETQFEILNGITS